jgi:hypothetical protein
VDPDITQLNKNLIPLQYNHTKDLTGRPNDKIAWSITLLGHTDVLQAYEGGLMEQELKEPPPPPPKHNNITMESLPP